MKMDYYTLSEKVINNPDFASPEIQKFYRKSYQKHIAYLLQDTETASGLINTSLMDFTGLK
jgi:hypothetical protein